MPDRFDVSVGKGGRIFVLLHADCKIEKEAILELLRQTGIDASDVTFLMPDEVETCSDLDGARIIIPIDAAVCDSPELDEACRHCGQVGGRVVVLFDKDFVFEGLHPIADKYGTQIGWSADQLEPCLAGDTPVEPRSATGVPVVRPKAHQVKC